METVMTRSELKEIIKECYLEIKADNISINEGISISKGFKYVIKKIIEGLKILKRKAQELLQTLKKKRQERKEERYNNIFTKIKKFIDDITGYTEYCENLNKEYEEGMEKLKKYHEEKMQKFDEEIEKVKKEQERIEKIKKEAEEKMENFKAKYNNLNKDVSEF